MGRDELVRPMPDWTKVSILDVELVRTTLFDVRACIPVYKAKLRSICSSSTEWLLITAQVKPLS